MLNYNLNINSPLQQEKKNEDVRPDIYWDFSSEGRLVMPNGTIFTSSAFPEFATMSINAPNSNCIQQTKSAGGLFTTDAQFLVTASLSGSNWPLSGSVTMSFEVAGITYDPIAQNVFYSSSIQLASTTYAINPSLTGSILTSSFNASEFYRFYVSGSSKFDFIPTEIVQDGLVLYLNAQLSSSYPGTGTTWFDLSPNPVNATLTDFSGSYNAASGGYFNILRTSSFATVAHNDKFNVFDDDYTLDMWYSIDGFGTASNFTDFAQIFSKPLLTNPTNFGFAAQRTENSSSLQRPAVFQVVNSTEITGSIFGAPQTSFILGEIVNYQVVRSGSNTTGFFNFFTSSITSNDINASGPKADMNTTGSIFINKAFDSISTGGLGTYSIAPGKLVAISLYNKALTQFERAVNNFVIGNRIY
jgi:hypothetical protein